MKKFNLLTITLVILALKIASFDSVHAEVYGPQAVTAPEPLEQAATPSPEGFIEEIYGPTPENIVNDKFNIQDLELLSEINSSELIKEADIKIEPKEQSIKLNLKPMMLPPAPPKIEKKAEAVIISDEILGPTPVSEVLEQNFVITENGDEINKDGAIDIIPEISRISDYLKFTFLSDKVFDTELSIRGTSVYLNFDQPNNIDFFSLIDDWPELKSVGTAEGNQEINLIFNGEIEKARKFLGDGNSIGFDIFFKQEEKIDRKKYRVMTGLPSEVIEFVEGFIGPLLKEEREEEFFDYSKVITYPKTFIGPPNITQIYKFNLNAIGPLEYNPYKYSVFEVSKRYGQNTLAPEVSLTETGTTVLFPLDLDEEVGTTAFLEGDKVNLIFEGRKKLFHPDIPKNKIISDIVKLDIENDEFTHLQVTIKPKALAKKIKPLFYLTKSGWVLEVLSNPENSEYDAIDIRTGFENKLGEKRLFFKSKKIKGPYIYTSPITGHKRQIFTIHENGVGISTNRELVDLIIDKTIQGINLYEKSDFINYNLKDADKLIITKLPNMQISDEAIASGQIADSEGGVGRLRTSGVFPERSIFPFAITLNEIEKKKLEDDIAKGLAKEESEEGDDDDEGEEEEKEEVKKEILKIDEPSFIDKSFDYFTEISQLEKSKRSGKKLELARYYFSKNLFSEANGVLKDIIMSDPKFKNIYEAKYILAATHYLTEKYDLAYAEFSELVEESKNNSSYNELLLWKFFSKYKDNLEKRLNDEITFKIDFVSSFDKFMQQYDKNTLLEFGRLYIQRKFEEKEIDQAKNLVEIVTYRGIPEELRNNYELIYAEIAEQEKDYPRAKEIYTKLTKIVDDRNARARALYAEAKLKLKLKEYDKQKAINQMLRASMVWRDDYLEIDILEDVADLYVDKKEYDKALDTLKIISANFSDTAENIFVMGRMKNIFVRLFDGGYAYTMPPLQALKVYFKYRELTPIGEVGDRITRKVSQFFADVDMIYEAIKIVEHQIKYRSQGEEKANLTLWLSDTLVENREEGRALQLLNKLDGTDLKPKLRERLSYKKAFITAKKGKIFSALKMIKGNESKDSHRVRLEVFWKRQNWFGIMMLMEKFRLDEIKETVPENLTRQEVRDIMRLAVAYSAQNMREGLKKLSKDFRQRIASKYDEEIFDYLVTPRLNIDYRKFEETTQMTVIEDYLKKFSFMENRHWQGLIDILEPRAEELLGTPAEEMTVEQRKDIVALGMAYALKVPADGKDEVENKKAYSNLVRNFRDVTVNRFTIDIFQALDSKAFPKEADAVFEGNIKLADIPDFVNFYKLATKMSLLNISIRGKF